MEVDLGPLQHLRGVLVESVSQRAPPQMLQGS